MKLFSSGIYDTRIYHRRRRPKAHKLAYGAFYLAIDLDELDALHRNLKWFSYNSFNLFSFYDRDHGPGSNEALRPWLEHHLERAGVSLEGGRIVALCLPRILGYVFNPLTVYYCYHASGQLSAVLYEVSNTFGQRHSYLFNLEAATREQRQLLQHECAKRFYVSPFISVSGTYRFSMRPPDEELFLHIRQADEDGPLLDAWINGSRQAISDRRLLGCLTRYPLLTLKVIGGIHWEALRLWLKGTGLIDRPEPPPETVTIAGRRPLPK